MATFNASQDGNWSEAATWGGAGVPGVGDGAVINGYTVQLDQDVEIGADSANFDAILISNGGKLVYPRSANRTLTFEGRILVSGAGSALDCGTVADPIQEGYTATLNLKRQSTDNNTLFHDSGADSSFVGARGSLRYYSEIGSNAASGQAEIVLANDVDIVAGDLIYINATEGTGQGEELTVLSYDSNTKTITCTTNLANTHNVGGCYVLLLTRNVVINKKFGTYGAHIYGSIKNMFWMMVKGYADAYGANRWSMPTYQFGNGWSDWDTDWQLCEKVVFYKTHVPSGSGSHPPVSDVIGFAGIAGYSDSSAYGGTAAFKKTNFYSKGVFVVGGLRSVVYVAAGNVMEFVRLLDYSPGVYSPLAIQNDGVIKSLQTSDLQSLYNVQISGSGKILNADLGYPVKANYAINHHGDFFGIMNFYNVNAFFNTGFHGNTAGWANRIYILQNLTENDVAKDDRVDNQFISVSLDSSIKKEGSNSLKFTVNSAGNQTRLSVLKVPTGAGKLLTVSGFWRHNSLFANRPTLRLIAPGIDQTTTMPDGADEWHPFVLSGVADFDGFADLILIWSDTDAGGIWWMDNITVNATRVDLGGLEFFGDNIFPPVILKTELDAADILRQSIASYTDSGTVGEAFNELALLRKLSKNKREIDTLNNQIVFYDDDGTTELLRINIYNAAGDPAYKNITKWEPV